MKVLRVWEGNNTGNNAPDRRLIPIATVFPMNDEMKKHG